jgi:hypothetical protein
MATYDHPPQDSSTILDEVAFSWAIEVARDSWDFWDLREEELPQTGASSGPRLPRHLHHLPKAAYIQVHAQVGARSWVFPVASRWQVLQQRKGHHRLPR